ncbi:MAG: flippase-like domain-containing protein [Calditrichaeota bacterium]|nr:flippase-like domain-containing protein [Calditrichota bacterium]
MRVARNILKIVISAGLLGYLIYKAEPVRVVAVFGKVQSHNGLVYLFIAFLTMLVAVWFLALRWQVLLRGYRFNLGTGQLFGFYLIGMFFNNFLPSSIGGDVMRIYKVIAATNHRASGFASVVIERIMGIAATLFLAILALVYVSQQFHDERLLYTALVLFFLIIVFFVSLMRDRTFRLILRLFDKFTIFEIGQKFNKLFEAIHYFQSRRRIFIFVFLLSLASQSSIVLMNFFLIKAFEIPVSLGYLFMVVPVTFVMTMLPSINGLGIRDLGFVSLLGQIGVTTAEALTLSFMNVIIPTIISIAGGILFMVQKSNVNAGGDNALESDF